MGTRVTFAATMAALLLLGAVASPTAAPADTPRVGKYVDHIIVFQFENHGYIETLLHEEFRSLMRRGTTLTRYHAVTHPSQPNYVAQVSGDTLGVTNDGYVSLNATNVVDLLEAKGLSWKAYMDSYPGDCNNDVRVGRYYRKHNPFISFENIRNNPARCARIVNGDQLVKDVRAGTLPNFSYFTPNIIHDAHSSCLWAAARWLHDFVEPLLKEENFTRRTLIVITWDEDEYIEGNRVMTILLGDDVRKDHKNDTYYTHYSLLRTVEDNFDLGTLGRNDAKAVPFDASVFDL